VGAGGDVTRFPFKVVCVSDAAYIGGETAPDGSIRLRAPRPGERTDLTIGKVYEVLEEDGGFYRVVDDSGEDYLHPRNRFRLMEA
jgi:hypothetical protein